MLAEQTILRRPLWRTKVVVFQNGNHVDVGPVLSKWTRPVAWPPGCHVEVEHIQSPIPTGYFGRFLVPLLSNLRPDGVWALFDDDLIFGSKYLANLERVVSSGALAVRVGRFIEGPTLPQLREGLGVSETGWKDGTQVTTAADVEYDFGGQVWAGKMSWLRALWTKPPPTLVTCEDVWISVVLRAFHGIRTVRPRCPPTDMEECACSMKVAHTHLPVEVGATVGGEINRSAHLRTIVAAYDYSPLGDAARATEARAYTFSNASTGLPFHTAGTRFSDCLYWI